MRSTNHRPRIEDAPEGPGALFWVIAGAGITITVVAIAIWGWPL